MFQNKEAAAILVYQTNSLGIELCFYADIFFCFGKAGQVTENALLLPFNSGFVGQLQQQNYPSTIGQFRRGFEIYKF